jgi:hypothetical protein
MAVDLLFDETEDASIAAGSSASWRDDNDDPSRSRRSRRDDDRDGDDRRGGRDDDAPRREDRHDWKDKWSGDSARDRDSDDDDGHSYRSARAERERESDRSQDARHDAQDSAGSDATQSESQTADSTAAGASGDVADTIALAPRYGRSGDRETKVEREWLRLEDYDGDRDGRDGYWRGDRWSEDHDGDGVRHWRDRDHDGPRHDNDTLVFHAAFGNDAPPEQRALDHVIDLSKSGYPTFQALQDAGALVQVGADVEITLNAADPAHPEKILLRSVDLSMLTANDFKFS